jgi:hypothetical protein
MAIPFMEGLALLGNSHAPRHFRSASRRSGKATDLRTDAKKISESGESGEWDSLNGCMENPRKNEMKPTVMQPSYHEFGQGVSLANPSRLKNLKIFFPL